MDRKVNDYWFDSIEDALYFLGSRMIDHQSGKLITEYNAYHKKYYITHTWGSDGFGVPHHYTILNESLVIGQITALEDAPCDCKG